jgi:hypothetical protein
MARGGRELASAFIFEFGIRVPNSVTGTRRIAAQRQLVPPVIRAIDP